ncbi:MAG TPA: ABC transporter permease [Patescibacteria group bacterium]|nr:ABC transporter permease [Patescibacteria group bacterium]
MEILYILWLRQVKKYFRSKSRIIGSLGQPLLYLLSFGYGFGSIFAKAGQGNYIQFLAPGIIAMSVLFTAIFSGIEIIWDRQFGFLKETMVAPVSRFTIMLGRTLGGATVSTFQGIIVLILASLVGFRVSNFSLLPFAILFMFIIALLFCAMGTALASTMQDMQGFQLVMNFLVMPIFFLSGSLFPLQGLPPLMEIATKIDPMTYGIDGLRGTLGGIAHFGLTYDILMLSGITLFFLLLGSYLFSKIQV